MCDRKIQHMQSLKMRRNLKVSVAGPNLSRKAADIATDEGPWPSEALLMEGF